MKIKLNKDMIAKNDADYISREAARIEMPVVKILNGIEYTGFSPDFERMSIETTPDGIITIYCANDKAEGGWQGNTAFCRLHRSDARAFAHRLMNLCNRIDEVTSGDDSNG